MKIEDEKTLEKIESHFEEQEAYDLAIKKLAIASKQTRDAAWKLIHTALNLKDKGYTWNKRTKEVESIE